MIESISLIFNVIATIAIIVLAVELAATKTEVKIWKLSHGVIEYQRDTYKDSLEYQRLVNLSQAINNTDTAIVDIIDYDE